MLASRLKLQNLSLTYPLPRYLRAAEGMGAKAKSHAAAGPLMPSAQNLLRVSSTVVVDEEDQWREAGYLDLYLSLKEACVHVCVGMGVRVRRCTI